MSQRRGRISFHTIGIILRMGGRLRLFSAAFGPDAPLTPRGNPLRSAFADIDLRLDPRKDDILKF
ncbi:MAG TPA: hypothetical protein VGT04_05360 [Acidobacteriaceae bacterium]|nr:hypothetical protein [Acidobacteriaceae bacterium]